MTIKQLSEEEAFLRLLSAATGEHAEYRRKGAKQTDKCRACGEDFGELFGPAGCRYCEECMMELVFGVISSDRARIDGDVTKTGKRGGRYPSFEDEEWTATHHNNRTRRTVDMSIAQRERLRGIEGD